MLKQSWLDGSCSLEIAKPEVDNQGYDVIAESCGVVRHIQLKTSHLTAATAKQNIHIALAGKPSGCVVWIRFDEKTLELSSFFFFGGRAGKPLPSFLDLKKGKHTKANADGIKNERPAMREVPKAMFTKCHSIEDLYSLLFKAG